MTFGRFSHLFGDILAIEIRKETKRLGIAIEGGADTKLKKIRVRQITVSDLVYSYILIVIMFLVPFKCVIY